MVICAPNRWKPRPARLAPQANTQNTNTRTHTHTHAHTHKHTSTHQWRTRVWSHATSAWHPSGAVGNHAEARHPMSTPLCVLGRVVDYPDEFISEICRPPVVFWADTTNPYAILQCGIRTESTLPPSPHYWLPGSPARAFWEAPKIRFNRPRFSLVVGGYACSG